MIMSYYTEEFDKIINLQSHIQSTIIPFIEVDQLKIAKIIVAAVHQITLQKYFEQKGKGFFHN